MLGSQLVPHLRASGHDVIRQSRGTDADIAVDLTDAQRTSTALDEVAPDVIVNLAALTNVDECQRDPQQAYLLNVRIVENIAGWIKAAGRKCHLVQLSTDHIYDGVGVHPEAGITLTNVYAFSKYAGELAAATVSSTVLRTNFFGRSQCEGRASLSDWLVTSLRRSESITVFDDILFSPLSFRSLVAMVERVIGVRIEGVFNLGARQGMSKADFAFALAEVLNLSTRTMRRGSSTASGMVTYRPKDMRMDSSRFEETFGMHLPALHDEINSMRSDYAQECR